MRFFNEIPHIEFIKNRWIAVIFSVTLILAGIVSLIVKGGPRYGIDFTGGALVQLKFEKSLSVDDLRKSIDDLKIGNYIIQEFGEKNNHEVLIRVEQSEGADLKGLGEKIAQGLQKSFPDNKADIRRVEMVGPQVGKELRTQAILALLYACIGMLIYVGWRFEFIFGFGAIVAIFHDLAITVGIFSLMNKEIDLTVLAALLTIAGYSINDTIVVFDRFRENLKSNRKESFGEILNGSINQTLSRTILTSLTTLFVTITLLVVGGEVIHNFAFALTIGIVIGTYSSIFVASPIVYAWHTYVKEHKVSGGKKAAVAAKR